MIKPSKGEKLALWEKICLVFPLLPFGMAWVAEAHGLLLMLMGDDSTRLGDRVSQISRFLPVTRCVFLRVFTKRKPLRKVAEAGGKGKHLHLRRGVLFFFRDTVYLAWTRPPHLTSLTRAAVDEYQGSETAGTTKSG
jgi:hypothetical protein